MKIFTIFLTLFFLGLSIDSSMAQKNPASTGRQENTQPLKRLGQKLFGRSEVDRLAARDATVRSSSSSYPCCAPSCVPRVETHRVPGDIVQHRYVKGPDRHVYGDKPVPQKRVERHEVPGDVVYHEYVKGETRHIHSEKPCPKTYHEQHLVPGDRVVHTYQKAPPVHVHQRCPPTPCAGRIIAVYRWSIGNGCWTQVVRTTNGYRASEAEVASWVNQYGVLPGPPPTGPAGAAPGGQHHSGHYAVHGGSSAARSGTRPVSAGWVAPEPVAPLMSTTGRQYQSSGVVTASTTVPTGRPIEGNIWGARYPVSN